MATSKWMLSLFLVHQNRVTYPVLGGIGGTDAIEQLLMPKEGDILLQGSGNLSPVAKLTYPVKRLASQSGRGQTHGNLEPVGGV